MGQSVPQRIAGSLLPALSFLIGLGGIPEDLEQWALWLEATRLPLAVWMLVVMAAVVLWLGPPRFRH